MKNGQVVYTSVDIQDKGMIEILGKVELSARKFQHTIQSSVQCKIHEFFISGIYHLTFSDHS
jgi:hypothetical protein